MPGKELPNVAILQTEYSGTLGFRLAVPVSTRIEVSAGKPERVLLLRKRGRPCFTGPAERGGALGAGQRAYGALASEFCEAKLYAWLPKIKAPDPKGRAAPV